MKRSVISLIMASFTMVLFITSCASNEGGDAKEQTTEESTSGEATQEKMAHYQCPMMCEGDKTYDQAGKCPVCQMDLAEVVDSGSDATEESTEDHAHEGHNHYQCAGKCEGDKFYEEAGTCPRCGGALAVME